MSESQPSQASGAEEWQAEPAGLLSSPVESVTQWITNIYRHEPGSSTRQEREEILRRQLISAYGLGDEETGQIESQDALEVESRLRLLGRLASTDTDHVDRARAEDFAYEFAH